MGVGRARSTVVMGTKVGEALEALDVIDQNLIQRIDL